MYLKSKKIKEIIIIIALLSTFVIGYIFNEDSLGGAKFDFYSAFERTLYFKESAIYYLLNYEVLEYRHSPIFFLFSASILNLLQSEEFYRAFHLIIPGIIFLFLYKSIEIRFTNINKSKIILLSSIIFLSPTIRSYSIWPDSYLYGLLFFTISVYYYLVFLKVRTKYYPIYLNIFFLSLSAYFMPTFSVFSIFFFINFSKILVEQKLLSRVFSIILINLFFALPAIYYIFYLDINFLKSSDEWGLYEKTFSALNISNKIFYSSCIIFFHLLPFIIIFFDKLKKSYFVFKNKNFYFFIFLFLISYYFSNYENIYLNLGGVGIFYQIFYKVIKFQEFQLILIIPIAFLFIFLFQNKFNNYLLLTLLIFSNFQLTIYHNYFEPILYIILFTLIKNQNIKKYLFLEKNIYLLFFFNFVYLLISLVK